MKHDSNFPRIGNNPEQAAHSAPATRQSLKEIVQTYTAKRDGGTVTKEIANGVVEIIAEYPGIEAEARAFAEATARVKSASAIGASYGGAIFSHRSDPETSVETMKAVLLRSAWRHVYEGLPIKDCASAKDRKQFDLFFENPPELTLAAIVEHFGAFLLDPRHHILKGLAECFCDLDPAYKSHRKVAIGVQGLPKRIIVNHVDRYLSSWGAERVKDTLNALRVYRGEARMEYAEWADMMDEARRLGEADFSGGIIRTFKNGNAHLVFDKHGLLDINRALAEFYGEVLPDAPSEAEAKRPSTEVARDLQFYPTPRAVTEQALQHLHLAGGETVLEPSCGTGAMMDILADWHNQEARWQRRTPLIVTGIEYDANRAEQARAKGHRVMTANFLQVAPEARFDAVVMNPPFYGQHYKRHLDHAVRFLRPGGRLVCVLPATAYYDRGNTIDQWRDLPVGSFAESGTNVPTGYCVYHHPEA